jgi:ankyrin repeat protein
LLQTKRELFADESFRLHHAIWANKGALVEQLLENKDLDPNAKDHHGMTPLHWAVILQRKEIAQSLIKCEKVKPETTDRLGETPFVYAYRLKSFSKQGVLFDWLVQEQGFDHNPLVYFHSLKESLRLLHSVAIANEIEIIEQLLCNEDINPNVVDSSYGTPLHCAAACGNIEAVIALLKCPRTQPDIKHSSQGTPLHIAAFYNRAEVIKELLALPGVDPNARHLSGKTPLHYAVMGKSAEAIDALLNNPRLDPDLLSPAGFTALQLAHKESMKVLLDHPRINPNQRNQHGQTVLHYAIDRNAIEEAKILINHSRVDPNLPPHRWFYPTPFEVAKRDGRSEIAELLRPKTYFLDRYISRRAQVSALGGLAGGLLGLMLAHSINRLYRSWSAIKQLSHHRWRNLTP